MHRQLFPCLAALASMAWSHPPRHLPSPSTGQMAQIPCTKPGDCMQRLLPLWPDTVVDAKGLPVAALGPEEPLFPDRVFPNLQYLPDEGTILLPAPAGRVRLLMAGPGPSYLVQGTGSLGQVQWSRSAQVLAPDPKSDFDNGYAGLSGAWMDRHGKLWAFYHAEDHVGIPTMPGTQIPGFYASIALATSTDSGRHWTRLGPVIRTQAQKIAGDSTRTDQGAAEPGVVASPDGKWLFVDWSDHSRPNNEGVRICLSRFSIARGTLVRSSCRSWDGTGFLAPCRGGQAEPVLRGGLVLGSPWNGDALEGHPFWVAPWKRYAMVFGIWPWQGVADTSLVGTYIAFSRDMIHWERPARLIHDFSIPQAGKSLRWEATLLPDGSSNTTAWLVYGHSPRWPDGVGGSGHRPFRRRLHWLGSP